MRTHIVFGLVIYFTVAVFLSGASYTVNQFGLETPPSTVVAATPAPTPAAPENPLEVESRREFRKALLTASRSAAEKGEITRLQALRIRIASFSPAFLDRAQEMCVVQMVFSGENQDQIPYNEDGTVDQTAIDWEGLATFLERILPLILELLLSLGLGG